LFYIACKAKRQQPAIIMVREPSYGDEQNGKKGNGSEGGDPPGNPT
jgi:hypothetical protein